MRSLSLLWCGNPWSSPPLSRTREEMVPALLLDTRVSVCMHVPPCAAEGFLEALKHIPFVLLMRHLRIRSLKSLASCLL